MSSAANGQRLSILLVLAVILIGLSLLGISDTTASVADTSLPDSKAASSISEVDNSSASATITITMYAVAEE